MAMDNLRELLIEDLKDLHNAETQLTKALPDMAEKATNSDLRKAFDTHLQQTERHIARLEESLSILGANGKDKRCKGMEGLIAEGKEVIKERADSDVKDAALIGAAQKVEHYEIAGYGTACTYASLLGETQIKELLGQTLMEEKQTDEKLTLLAERFINTQAAS